ncbi:cytochrome c oxidase subunit 3 [Variovorax paradoxus]|jgi:cytochrome c oxidase subunit I+III|uniref:Putative cytochrome c oxidase subunit I n=1 Tax=Variovorax paradoxus (strain S110) TaxID=543728 RepID=C5CLF4_VARPS|nr:cytochrome c oxidase subunit 3 [Variovorax paradoxus]MBW8717278.1 cytochrome c oxidase subunit 3 [Variovorax paradoxus]
MTAPRRELDVSALPSYAFGHRSLMWWGTFGLIAIEGTIFAIAIGAYLYLRSQADSWPLGAPPPDLLWGSANTLILLASIWPNQKAKRAAEARDLVRTRGWLLVCLLFALAFLVLRGFEFAALHTRWDHNAYGSVVWTLLGLHTVHLLTDTYDTAVLDVLLFTGPMEGQRFVDVSENALYWYFVVFSWLPIYAVIYGVPRLH